MASRLSAFLHHYGHDLILGSIASFYVFAVPYTKVEESFNVQAIHDILYHKNHLVNVIFLTLSALLCFLGAFVVALLSSPCVLLVHLLRLPKVYALVAVRLVLGCAVLWPLRSFRREVRRKFGDQVEAFFVAITSVQFHFLFYCTRTLPNVFSLACVLWAYSYWLQGRYYAAINCLAFSTLVFRCDMLILLGPLVLELLLTKCVSILGTLKNSFGVVLLSIALPRSLVGAYVIFMIGIILERRLFFYVFPVFAFVMLYSYLPHKELRFIISAIPMFNLSAAVAASRICINRKKSYVWRIGSFALMGLLLISTGCTLFFFMASYNNYPSGVAIKELHNTVIGRMKENWVHIDTFSAMNGISRFCENGYPWSEHREIKGYTPLFSVEGFTGARLKLGVPPIHLLTTPKVYVHQNSVLSILR